VFMFTNVMCVFHMCHIVFFIDWKEAAMREECRRI